ncbi:MAG: hypothetical protein A3I73_02965 [Omnitrophica bacterium RIFCSPLOWO2_02_FULL_45_16]|nr:MAG: hypothetical protein A3C51_06260 [Omnitrophica bacterium RIFCSPHIGHO2_02_FULL_46_20]OGW94025.1 MAG: hypothetical protein A3K16_04725 [Omnitrophica bacterium RIFCSPLOWO2_01_FULL_45_24]OGW94582.1 MAG: hypothetical protein A3G36_06505 [Omnitrophica bacterium RIFCSPLOWO2_12_FULL_45_13]OGX00975.1 MAG: hypothetical protein A3I73_02965 [Omnitrophica bacterium RIFCSPLOWO2_02_FULL_45_16]
MTNKTKFTITAIVLIVILLSGITFGTRIIFTKKMVPPKDPKGVFITGIRGGQRAGLIKEMENLSREHVHADKGNALLKENRIDEAIEAYKIALTEIKSSGGRGVVIASLVGAYEKKRDYAHALEYAIIDRDKYINDWAKEPVVERVKYLEYALQGEYDLAVEHAQKALELDVKLFGRKKPREDYIERLNDLKAAKDYILGFKKQ